MSNAPSTTHVIYTHLDLEGCTAELWLNDIPISRLVAEFRRVESTAVQQYLFDGPNRLELLIEPGTTPAVSRTERRELLRPKARVSGRIVKYPDGADLGPENGEVLAEVNFLAEELAPKPGDPVGPAWFPRSVSTDKDLGKVAGRWAFQDAPVLTLNDELVAEASAVLEEVAAAIARGDAVTFMALLSDQHADVLRAYPAFTLDRIRADVVDYVSWFSRAKQPVLPREPEKYSFRLAAGGRLLQCLCKDWEGCVRMVSPDDGGISPYPLFLARLGGRLRIVR